MIDNKEMDFKKELKNGIMEAFKVKFNQTNKFKLDFRELKKISSTTGFFKKNELIKYQTQTKQK